MSEGLFAAGPLSQHEGVLTAAVLPGRNAEESLPVAEEPGLPAGHAGALGVDGSHSFDRQVRSRSDNSLPFVWLRWPRFAGDVRTDGLFQRAGAAAGWEGDAYGDGGLHSRD